MNSFPAPQDGNTVVVCTCAAVSSMVTGVLVGLLALGERMPSSRAARAVILASWLAITLGVSGLANGPGECLPALARMMLPYGHPIQPKQSLDGAGARLRRLLLCIRQIVCTTLSRACRSAQGRVCDLFP